LLDLWGNTGSKIRRQKKGQYFEVKLADLTKWKKTDKTSRMKKKIYVKLQFCEEYNSNN